MKIRVANSASNKRTVEQRDSPQEDSELQLRTLSQLYFEKDDFEASIYNGKISLLRKTKTA